MVISMIEATLDDGQGKRFLEEFRKTVSDPAQQLMPDEAFVAKQADGTTWRLIAFWKDRAVFEAMRAAMTPRGLVMMRAAGVEPTLTLFDVIDRMPVK
jgi:hypothetical protein